MSYSSRGILFYGFPLPEKTDISSIEDVIYHNRIKNIHPVSYANGLSGSLYALALKVCETDIYNLKKINVDQFKSTPEEEQKLKDFCEELKIPYERPQCYLTGDYS